MKRRSFLAMLTAPLLAPFWRFLPGEAERMVDAIRKLHNAPSLSAISLRDLARDADRAGLKPVIEFIPRSEKSQNLGGQPDF